MTATVKLRKRKQEKYGNKNNFRDYEGIYNTFVEFAGVDLTFTEVTENYCKDICSI